MTAAQMPRATSLETPKKKQNATADTYTPEKRKRSLLEIHQRMADEATKRRRLQDPSATKATEPATMKPVLAQKPPQKELSKAAPEVTVAQAAQPPKEASRGVSLSPESKKRAILAISAPGTVPRTTPGYEASELKKILAAQHVPDASSELLLPLLQRWGSVRLGQVLGLWNFLGEGMAGRKPCSLKRRSDSTLHVWGPRGTGKSGLVDDYLQSMRFPCVKLNGLGFANQLEAHQQLVNGLTWAAIKRQRAAKSEIESLDPAAVPKNLRQLDKLEAALDVPLATLDRLGFPQVIIVIDQVEEAYRRIGREGLELLMKLPETLPHRGSMLGLVLIGREPLSGLCLRPPTISFPAYNETQLEVLLPHLLRQKFPDVVQSLGDANWVVVMTCLIQSARPTIGVDLGLLMEVGTDVLNVVRRSSGDETSTEAGAASGRQLRKNPSLGELTETINDLITEAYRARVDLKPFAGQASIPEARADAVVQGMTKEEKQLLLATYLGAYVKKKDDRRLFLGMASKRKVTVRKNKEDDNIPCWVKAPHAVPLMRLLAIYHKLALARTSLLTGSRFWLPLISLKEAGFVRIRNERGIQLDKEIKVDNLASMYVARACAIHLGVDLAEYLCQ